MAQDKTFLFFGTNVEFESTPFTDFLEEILLDRKVLQVSGWNKRGIQGKAPVSLGNATVVDD